MMDLFQLAVDNTAELDRRLSLRMTNSPAGTSGILDQFARKVKQDGRISINLRPQTLLNFLDTGAYQNIYEWARSQSTRSTKNVETILRERLGRWYQGRIGYDRYFKDGELFRYGALNIGGDGSSHYGSFCMIIQDAASERWGRVAYVSGDSLSTYVDAASKIDARRLAEDAGSHSHRQHVAALKHEPELPTTPEHGWPAMLCSAGRYVEAVFVGDLTLTDLESVRLGKAEYELLFDFAFEDFSAKLSDQDRLWVDTFRMVLERLHRNGIRLEVV